MEVQQPADRKTAHARVGLRRHAGRQEQRRHGLDLQDGGFVRQEIGLESQRERLTGLDRWNAHLAPHRTVSLFRFIAEGGDIKRFQQSRTGVAMQLDRQPNNAFSALPMAR